jgi:hypothetical protein
MSDSFPHLSRQKRHTSSLVSFGKLAADGFDDSQLAAASKSSAIAKKERRGIRGKLIVYLHSRHPHLTSPSFYLLHLSPLYITVMEGEGSQVVAQAVSGSSGLAISLCVQLIGSRTS